MNRNICWLVFLSLFGTIFGQISNSLDLDDISKQLKDNGGSAVNDLEKKLEENGLSFNNTQVNPEKIENILREKCEKHGAGDVVESVKNQKDELQSCLTKNINTTQIQDELEQAKKTGSMDEVFAKYCKRWPDIYSCVENVTSNIRRCMNDKEIKGFNKTLVIMNDLQDFMCFKDGDRLAMFVAEGGVECIDEKQEGIKSCINSTVGNKLSNADQFSIDSLPLFLFGEEECNDFENIRICVNEVLEKCQDTTPANIVDAFFKFLKKQISCDDVAQVKPQGSSSLAESNSSRHTVNFVFVLLGLLMLVKFY